MFFSLFYPQSLNGFEPSTLDAKCWTLDTRGVLDRLISTLFQCSLASDTTSKPVAMYCAEETFFIPINNNLEI